MQVSINTDRIGSVMDNVWFESRPGQTKDYIICICYFSAKHAASRRKSKYWFARCSAISWREHDNFHWDDEVHFVLDQHA
jgi:hypothetical protein